MVLFNLSSIVNLAEEMLTMDNFSKTEVVANISK